MVLLLNVWLRVHHVYDVSYLATFISINIRIINSFLEFSNIAHHLIHKFLNWQMNETTQVSKMDSYTNRILLEFLA